MACRWRGIVELHAVAWGCHSSCHCAGVTIERRELERNGSRDGASDGRSRGTSRIVGIFAFSTSTACSDTRLTGVP